MTAIEFYMYIKMNHSIFMTPCEFFLSQIRDTF